MIPLLLFLAMMQTGRAQAPPDSGDTFTTRATCRIDSPQGVYIYYEDGQHGRYDGFTAEQLGLAYAPQCGFPLPNNANGVVRPTEAQVIINPLVADGAETLTPLPCPTKAEQEGRPITVGGHCWEPDSAETVKPFCLGACDRIALTSDGCESWAEMMKKQAETVKSQTRGWTFTCPAACTIQFPFPDESSDVPAIQKGKEECFTVPSDAAGTFWMPDSELFRVGSKVCYGRYWTCADTHKILLHDEDSPPKYWCHKVSN